MQRREFCQREPIVNSGAHLQFTLRSVASACVCYEANLPAHLPNGSVHNLHRGCVRYLPRQGGDTHRKSSTREVIACDALVQHVADFLGERRRGERLLQERDPLAHYAASLELTVRVP